MNLVKLSNLIERVSREALHRCCFFRPRSRAAAVLHRSRCVDFARTYPHGARQRRHAMLCASTAVLAAALLLHPASSLQHGSRDNHGADERRGRPWISRPPSHSVDSFALHDPARALSSGAGGRSTTTTEFRWSYFPTYDTIRFVVLDPPTAASEWKITLTQAAAAHTENQAALSELRGKMPIATSGETWRIPSLAAGSYTVTMEISSSAEQGSAAFVQTDSLNRTVRPWENEALGTEDILLPPFTAMTVNKASADGGEGTTVGVVARNMVLSSVGLWSSLSITPPATPREPDPAPIEMLSKPIELAAVIGGKTFVAAAASASALKVTKATKTAVETSGGWTAGPLSGSISTHYDPDGCMRVELSLDTSETPITELTLRIPVKLEEAPFLHAVTDLLRQHYAGRIPAGEGEVYNTTGITRYQLPGPFVPYIWVGGAARGIAFFADNDKDWLPAAPAYQLIRDSAAGTVTLVVNLISSNAVPAGGAVLNRPRHITFGLMASPAKPQAAAPLDSPRQWWLVGGASESQVSLEFLGADYYWGSQTPCLAYYPFLHNYSVFDWLVRVRDTGSVEQSFSNASIPMDPTHQYPYNWIREQWMPLYTPENCHSCTTASLFNVYESIQYSAHQMLGDFQRRNLSAGSPAKGIGYVVPYTNARGVVWDSDTAQFMDEWTEYDVADPRWNAPLAGGADAPWCKCGSQWCEDVDYLSPLPHTPVSCSANSTAADLPRFRRSQSAELSKNASIGLWAGFAYQTDPVKSYADMALHYTMKMLETFADGVYYDDVFLDANFVPAPAGPAYVDDHGTLRPGVNLWAWRDFLRRSATLQHTIARAGGKPTVLYIHMTNVNMIPLLSWGSVNLDWEWRDEGGMAELDVQTRNQIGCDDHGQQCNDTSFILAQTAGLQSGNIPIAISSGLRGPNCTSRPDLHGTNCTAWLMKTQYATCIPHEVRPEGTPWGQTILPASPDGAFEETPTTLNTSAVLEAYGYGDVRCDVFRFWEKDFPIETSGPYVLPLVVRCDTHVMTFFGSFDRKGMVNFQLKPSLGVSAGARAFDAETGAKISPVSGSGNFSFSLDKHSFKIVVVERDR